MKKLSLLLLIMNAIVTHGQSFPELRVVATTPLLAGVAQAVGGERVQVLTLTPADQPLAAYQLSADDLAAVQEADLLLVEGSGAEPFLTDLLDNTDTPYHLVSEGAAILGLPAPELTDADAAVYMALENTSRSDLSLITVTGDWFTTATLHATMHHNNMMMMTALDDGLPLPPATTVELAPGGTHLMLEGVQVNLVDGATLPLTLRFSDGSEVTADVLITADDPSAGTMFSRVEGKRVVVARVYAYPLTVLLSPVPTEDQPLGRLGDDVTCSAAPTSRAPQPTCNPYLYSDPTNVSLWARNLALIFADADPDHAADYDAAATQYIAAITAADTTLAQVAATLAADCVLPVGQPGQWAYVARRYGLSFGVATGDTRLADDLLLTPTSALTLYQTLAEQLATTDCLRP